MQPLSEEDKSAIRDGHPNAEPGEIERDLEEYETLLADRFTEDPDVEEGPAAAPRAAPQALSLEATPGQSRLKVLHAKLFHGEE